MILIKDFFCMILCAIGAYYFASSEAWVNISASGVLGSSGESALSAKHVAVGIVFALLALGSIAKVTKSKHGQYALWTVTGLAALFSSILTITGVSIDYAANDHSGKIQGARQDSNLANVKMWERERRELLSGLDDLKSECKKDHYFGPCQRNQARISELSDKIEAANTDSMQSIMTEQVDISEAVFQKAGIPGLWVERALIYLRGIVAPILISVLMFGFWTFFENVWGEYRRSHKAKKPRGSGAPSRPTPKKEARKTVPEEKPNLKKVIDNTVPKKTNDSNRTSPKPRGSRDRSGTPSGTVTAKVQLPKDLQKRVRDDEVRFLLVEYLVLTGKVPKPTNRAIRALGIGDAYAKQYIERMENRGNIKRHGQGKANTVVESRRIHKEIDRFERLIA